MKNRDIQQRLDCLEQVMMEKSFLANQGLGNEVGYYIFDYPPTEELRVRERMRAMAQKYQGGEGITLKVFDLYDIVLDMLEEEGFREMSEEFEEKKGFFEITSAINELLRMEEDNEDNLLLSYLHAQMKGASVAVLCGVGKIFPLLRSHKILNNLHQFIDEIPVIMLFPGVYDGSSLTLFSTIKDNNYYRAFRIAE